MGYTSHFFVINCKIAISEYNLFSRADQENDIYVTINYLCLSLMDKYFENEKLPFVFFTDKFNWKHTFVTEK